VDLLTTELIKQLGNVHSLLEVYDIEIYYGQNRENNWIDVTHPMIKPISSMATWVIFTDRGHVNQQAIRDIRNAGYGVFQVEVDPHYGWVTAGISIPGLGVITVYNDNLNNRWKKRGTN
jgi:hypothetical protein